MDIGAQRAFGNARDQLAPAYLLPRFYHALRGLSRVLV